METTQNPPFPFDNSELLFGSLEAGRQVAETQARDFVVDHDVPEIDRCVVLLDNIVTAIEAFQAEYGGVD